MQQKFNNTQAQVSGLHNELNATRNVLLLTKNSLKAIQSSSRITTIKPRKHESLSGKGSVRSWIIHVNNYIGNEQNPQALSVAVSYLHGAAHEW